MAHFLPILEQRVVIVEKSGAPTSTFQQWWQQVVEAIGAAANILNGTSALTAPITLASFEVADLPAAPAGSTAYASDGRKNGEGVGAGTGVLVFRDATNWIACDSGQTVQA